MPYQSQLSQGPDLLRQFMVTLFPGFTQQKEDFLASRIGKTMRLPGMDVQEGLNFNQNKTSPFTPDFNGSGPFPFMFAGGNYSAPIGGGGGSGGDPHSDDGDDEGAGGGHRKRQDPPPPPPPNSGSSSSSSSGSSSSSESTSSFSDSNSSAESTESFDPASQSSGGSSESAPV